MSHWPPITVHDDLAMALAIDEAMLEATAEEGTARLWFWTIGQPSIVLGRSSRHDLELKFDAVDRLGWQVGRRLSGGATVVAGPGCLMYAVALPMTDQTEIRGIDGAHDYVMHRMLEATRRQRPEVRRQGICDLTIDDRKFSGNALRITRDAMLYHGTLLHDFDLASIGQVLDFAPRQPEYRGGRHHLDFVANLRIDVDRWCRDVSDAFNLPIATTSRCVNADRVAELIKSRYGRTAWTRRH